jgi:hypothetical protein
MEMFPFASSSRLNENESEKGGGQN